MLKKIISGCQTGADIAGIDAAIANGFPYDGWIPKDRKTENGPLSNKYNVREMPTSGYPKRTERNVIDSDGTAIFTHGSLSGGSELTKKYAIKHGKHWIHLNMLTLTTETAALKLHEWIYENKIEVLNVAGRSASKDKEIYNVTLSVINCLFRNYK